MSHIGILRYQALQFLASKAVTREASQTLAVTSCLQAESVEITSTRTPERVLKTTKMGTLTPVGQSPGSTELCVRWLIGTPQTFMYMVKLTSATSTVEGEFDAAMEGHRTSSCGPI